MKRIVSFVGLGVDVGVLVGVNGIDVTVAVGIIVSVGTGLAIGTYVKEAGLDVSRFLVAYTGQVHGPEIDEDLAAGRAIGITGTPSFLLGTSDGTTIEGERIVGAKSFAYFQTKIEALLAAAETASMDPGE